MYERNKEFDKVEIDKSNIIYNGYSQNITNPQQGKYIIETIKVEVFCKPENIIIYHNANEMNSVNQNIPNNKINIWKKENCCLSTESLICLGD